MEPPQRGVHRQAHRRRLIRATPPEHHTRLSLGYPAALDRIASSVDRHHAPDVPGSFLRPEAHPREAGEAEEGLLPAVLVGLRRRRPSWSSSRSAGAWSTRTPRSSCPRRCRRSSRRSCTTATAPCSPRSTARSTARSSRSTRCPSTLRDAVVAVEDHGFYDHPGIDPVGILRAAWTDLVKHDTVQGGSTITQQLVKQVYAGQLRRAAGRHDGVRRSRPARSRRRSARRCWRSSSSRRCRRTRSWRATSTRSTWGTAPTACRRRRRRTGASTPPTSPSSSRPRSPASSRRRAASTRSTTPRTRRCAATTRSTRWCATGTSIRRRRTSCRQEKVHDGSERAEVDQRAGQLRVLRGLREALPDRQVRRRGGLRRRLPGDDLARPRVAARGGGGRERAPPEPVRSGRSAGRDRPADRRDPGDGRRPRLQELAGEPGGSGLRLRSETFGGTGRQSGSSFKAFTLAAAMHAGYDLNATWYGPGTITIPNTECYTDGAPWELSNASDSEAGTSRCSRRPRTPSTRCSRRSPRSSARRRSSTWRTCWASAATWTRCARSRSASRP